MAMRKSFCTRIGAASGRKMLCGALHAVIVAMAGLACTPAAAGTITGAVVFEGRAPVMKAIDMGTDAVCEAKHDKPPRAEFIVLGEGQTLANVFVHVIKGLPRTRYPAPAEPVVLDQEGCRYAPHVFGVIAGQDLKIVNPDGTLHNVHCVPKRNRGFNITMVRTLTETTVTFPIPEPMFPFKCDVHPWMLSYCAVMAHPFFSVTGIDGAYTIEGLDAGEYVIEAWHERLGTQTATVTIGADSTTSKNFTFARP